MPPVVKISAGSCNFFSYNGMHNKLRIGCRSERHGGCPQGTSWRFLWLTQVFSSMFFSLKHHFFCYNKKAMCFSLCIKLNQGLL